MKTSTILFAFASGALAQIATVTDVITKVGTATTALDSAIKAYSGGAVDAILSANSDVNSVVATGITAVNGIAQLALNDALGLTTPVQGLATIVGNTIDDLIAKKSQIVAAGAGAKIEEGLKAQLSGAQDLAKAISAKVPADVAPIASQLSATISTAIQKGVDAYADAGGPPSSGSSSSAAGGASSSVTASASASSAASSAGSSDASASKTKTKSGTTAPASTTSSPVAVSTGGASTNNKGFFGAGLAIAAALVL